jgi:microcystin-dependent protein
MEDKYLIAACFVLIAYLFYKQSQLSEPMADVQISDQIKEAVRAYYLVDVEATRNLSLIATKLQAGGLTVPGNLTITGGLNVAGAINYLPKGLIVAWSGTDAPTGWALCDGQKVKAIDGTDLQTPDLRGRFVRMYSDNLPGDKGFADYVVTKPVNSSIDKSILGNSRTDTNSWIYKMKVGEFGGTDHNVLDVREMPVHTHGMDAAGNHSHSFEVGDGGYPAKGWFAAIITDRVHNKKNTADAGNHVHSVQNTGGGLGHNNIPPFYVLAYIIKL